MLIPLLLWTSLLQRRSYRTTNTLNGTLLFDIQQLYVDKTNICNHYVNILKYSSPTHSQIHTCVTWAVSWSILRPIQHHHYSTTLYSSSCMGGGCYTWASSHGTASANNNIGGVLLSSFLLICSLVICMWGGNVTSWDFITGTNWILSSSWTCLVKWLSFFQITY